MKIVFAFFTMIYHCKLSIITLIEDKCKCQLFVSYYLFQTKLSEIDIESACSSYI